MNEKMLQEMESKLYEIFGSGEYRTYYAPGRVNLIGEHTDYNGGHVFPCALTVGTYGLVKDRPDQTIRMYSMNFNDRVVQVDIDDLDRDRQDHWSKYVIGVIRTFVEKGCKPDHGLEIMIFGDIPNGSGLSSSASLEVLIGTILKDTFDFPVSMVDVALYGQYAENNYCGCNCGIMDQFASAMGRKDHAILLDTNTLDYEYVPIVLKEEKIVITNSKVKHNLADGGYNNRREGAEAAFRDLHEVLGIKTLCEIDEIEFERNRTVIKDEVNQRRAKHAIYENQRTLRAVDALRSGDIETFGKLMYASHMSLRDDYEVSCDEVDILVDLASQVPGVLGSRITGGGFGGCTVSIVKTDYVQSFVDMVGAAYEEATGITADFYVVDVGRGAGRILPQEEIEDGEEPKDGYEPEDGNEPEEGYEPEDGEEPKEGYDSEGDAQGDEA